MNLFLFQKILNDFVTVEMAFHAKALEMLTSSYQSLDILNEEEDLEVSIFHCLGEVKCSWEISLQNVCSGS
jgi:hypothetical protein